MEKEECYINLIKYYEDMKAILDELLNYKSILEKTLDSPQKMYLYKINKYIKEINTGTYNTFYNLKSKMKKIIKRNKFEISIYIIRKWIYFNINYYI